MAYIGNARTPLIFASNVRDDIIPVRRPDGSYENEFLLSQEVPGGYENNILVLRRRTISDPIINSTGLFEFTFVDDITGRKCYLSTTDDFLAAALNVVQPPTADYQGDSLEISGASNASNNGTFKVLSKNYTRNSITFQLETENIVAEVPTSLSVKRVYYAPWEILDAEKDYVIKFSDRSSAPNEYNRILSLTDAPQEFDILYVLHRGEATYNFVPSPNSVGPDQLSHNLRNFFCDRFEVVDAAGQDTFLLGQDVVSSRALLVTVNGQITDGDDPESGFDEGQWQLLGDGKSIQFKTPVAQNSLVKVLHLGFSTISRRNAFVLGQGSGNLLDGSVTASKLANEAVIGSKLATGSVQNIALANDSVTADKILLQNNTFIRSLSVSNTPVNILGLDNQNNLHLSSQNNKVVLWGSAGVSLQGGATPTDKIVVAEDGKIGLNTTNPSTDVEASGKVKITRTDQSNSQFMTVESVGDGHIISTYSATNSVKGLHIRLKTDEQNTPATTSTPYLAASVSILNNQFVRIMSDGKLGLGKTPTTTLDVDGTVKASNIDTSTINGVSLTSGFGFPTGTVVMSALDVAPAGWLLCDGREHPVGDYPVLAAALGNKFGAASVSTKFKVPDLRKRVAVGADVNNGIVVPNQIGMSDNLAVADRTLTHKHSGAPHTHSMSHTHTVPPHIHEIVGGTPTASTLAITNSGNHNTSLLHRHTNVSGQSDWMETATDVAGYTGSHLHKITLDSSFVDLRNHTHPTTVSGVNGTAVASSWTHGHSNSTTSTDGSHAHVLNATGRASGNTATQPLNWADTASGEFALVRPGNGIDRWTGFAADGGPSAPDGGHTHSVSVGESFNLNHNHTVTVSNSTNDLLNHRHTIDGFTVSDSNPAHKHLIRFPESTVRTSNTNNNSNSTSDGAHTHSSSFFEGAIGYANIIKTLAQPTLVGQSTSNMLTLQNVTDLYVGSVVLGATIFQGQSAIITAINGNVVTLDRPVLISVAAGTQLTMRHPTGNLPLTTTGQSVANTGGATQSDTGEASSPYIILNFIIKT